MLIYYLFLSINLRLEKLRKSKFKQIKGEVVTNIRQRGEFLIKNIQYIIYYISG